MKKIYLAIPYSGIEEESFKVANEVASLLIANGNVVFSPISHSHPIWHTHMVEHNYKVWLSQDKHFVEWCDELYVINIIGLTKDGMKLIDKSKGVKQELHWACGQNKPIHIIHYDINTKKLTI